MYIYSFSVWLHSKKVQDKKYYHEIQRDGIENFHIYLHMKGIKTERKKKKEKTASVTNSQEQNKRSHRK